MYVLQISTSVYYMSRYSGLVGSSEDIPQYTAVPPNRPSVTTPRPRAACSSSTWTDLGNSKSSPLDQKLNIQTSLILLEQAHWRRQFYCCRATGLSLFSCPERLLKSSCQSLCWSVGNLFEKLLFQELKSYLFVNLVLTS